MVDIAEEDLTVRISCAPESIQATERATRAVERFDSMGYEEYLKELGICRLKERRKKNVLAAFDLIRRLMLLKCESHLLYFSDWR